MSKQKSNGKTVKRYNVNLDKDTAVVLSRAFNDMFLDFQKEKIKQNTTIPLSDKTKKNFGSIITHLEDFIKKNHNEDEVVSYELKDIKKQFENNEYNIDLIKKIWSLFNRLETIDLILFVLEENKKKSIKFLRNIAHFGNIIPFQKFSIQEHLYKQFEKIIDDKNKEIDNYKHINTSIISMIFSSISAIGALFTIQQLPEQFQGFIYWFIVVLLLVFIFYFIDFISNLIQIRKNKYILVSLNAFTEPFDEPDKNINEEYIDYLKTFLLEIKEFKKSNQSTVDFKYATKVTHLFMFYRKDENFKFYGGVLIDVLKNKLVFILVVIAYFSCFYLIKDNFISIILK